MEYITYENKKIELKDDKYNMKQIFNILNRDYESHFKTNEIFYYNINEFENICEEDNKEEIKLLLYLKKHTKDNIFEFITNRGYNLQLGNLFRDIWYPLFEKKNILITSDILIFINYGKFQFQTDSEIIQLMNQSLIELLNEYNIKLINITFADPLSLEYEYIQNEIKQLTPNDLNKKTWNLLSVKNFKSLIMQLNTKVSQEVKEYYISLEEILNEYSKYLKEKEILELREEIKNLESKTNLENFINNVKGKEKTEYIYIATSKMYAQNNYYKIGRTDNLKNRLSDFNTAHVSGDTFYFCYYEKVYEANTVEKLINNLFEPFKEKKNKEIFHIHYKYLEDLIPLVIKNTNESFEFINISMKNKLSDMICSKPYIPKELLVNEEIIEDDLKKRVTQLLDKLVEELKDKNKKQIGKKKFLERLNYPTVNKHELWQASAKKILKWVNSATPILHKDTKIFIIYNR